MKISREPKVTCCIYVPERIKARFEKWAGELSNKDRVATPGDAATKAIDALVDAKWMPGMKVKALK